MGRLHTCTQLFISISITFAFDFDTDLDMISPLDTDLEKSMAKLFQEYPKREIDNVITKGDVTDLKLKEDEIDKLFKLTEDISDLKHNPAETNNAFSMQPKNNRLGSKIKEDQLRKNKVKPALRNKLEPREQKLTNSNGIIFGVKPIIQKDAWTPPSLSPSILTQAMSSIPGDFRRQGARLETAMNTPKAEGSLCCYSMQCYNPCPFNMFPYSAIPVPNPMVVPARAFYEPVIHDHPPLDKIRRIIKNDKRRHKKRRYSSEEYSESISQEYYDDFMNVRAPGY